MANTNLSEDFQSSISKERSALMGHEPCVLWFTGLSGSGKTSVATALEQTLLRDYRLHTSLLDADAVRGRLNRDLGYSNADRSENIRRLAEVARILYDAGLIVLVSAISPFRVDRAAARALFPAGRFVEVHMNCPIETCRQRDPKGLYQKADRGQIPEFTGISSPYEAPLQAEIVLDSEHMSVEECVERVVDHLRNTGCLTLIPGKGPRVR